MRSRRWIAVVATGSLALTVAACGGNDSSSGDGTATQRGGTLNGAGATFPAPVYSEWAARLKEAQGTTVNYQAVGSGAGIAQFSAGTVDFGATDAAMKDEEISAVKQGDPVHIPTVLGAVTVSYNVSGLDRGLKLDGATIADIFLGKIKRWDDAAIIRLNPDVKPPGTDISVCHRSDESGTTKNFTEFLAGHSAAWKTGPGVDKSVKWPTGTGAKGNDGVAGCVKQTDGGVGYVEQAFALQNDFTTAAVKNRAGSFVAPTLEATSAAGEGAAPPEDLRFSTIDADGEQAYPITAVTFLLVYRDACRAGLDKTKAGLLKDWLSYALGDGQAVAPELEYAPLPDAIKTRARAKVDGLLCDGAAIAG